MTRLAAVNRGPERAKEARELEAGELDFFKNSVGSKFEKGN